MGDEHILVVHGWDAEDVAWDYDIEHPASCPREKVYFPPFAYIEYDCDVAHALGGEDSFSDPPREPGRYRIKAWHSVSSTLDGTDYDCGLVVLGRE